MGSGSRIKNKLKEFFYGILDIPYLSPELLSMPRPLLVHISDTPSMSYMYLSRLLRRLAPEHLVHTGDMVDEIKLEFAPSQVDEYRNKLRKLLQLIRASVTEGVYLVPGNHDDPASLRELGADMQILTEQRTVDLGGYRFRLDHEFQSAAAEADFHLFGHNPETSGDRSARPLRLNGLDHIHIISLVDGRIYNLPYPAGTDNARKMLMLKIGM
jgi:predicted phosphodiesterase